MPQWVIKLFLGLAGKFLVAVITRVTSSKDFDQVLVMARQHVLSLINVDTLSNSQKRDEVFKLVRADIKKAELLCKDAVVNLAIELALNAVKAGVAAD